MKHLNHGRARRGLGLLVTLCLLLALLPAAAFAAEPAEPIQLTTPTNLTWGKDENGADIPGLIGWTVDEEGYCQNRFKIAYYRNDETDPVSEGKYDAGDERQTAFSDYQLIKSDFADGTYYFTVQSLGDGTEYLDSEVAVSEAWTYTQPEGQLEAIYSNPTWEWPQAVWEILPADTTCIYGIEVEYFFSETEDGTPQEIGWSDVTGLTDDDGLVWRITEDDILDEYIAKNGNGYYYFRVRTLSRDITKYRNSPWTELSPAYNLDETSAGVKESLNEILNREEADVREAVQELDRAELRSSMLADTEVLDLITQLEETTGVTVDVAVSEDLDSVFAESGVQIVGAALNEVSEGTEHITLQIDRPKDTALVIPELYNQTLAVEFSMDLEGVENTGELAVPVRVTLPVPSTINPAFLTILHYAQDGSAEIMTVPDLYIYQEDGQYYVSFVLDHFSDFVMTEQIVEDNPGGDTTPDDDTIPDDNTTSGGEPSTGSSGGSSSGGGGSSAVTYRVSNTTAKTENGTISLDKAKAEAGAVVTVTASPDAGYEVDAITVTDAGGKAVKVTDNGDGTYRFTMPAGKVSVEASFRASEAVSGPAVKLPFTDVPEDSWAYDAIAYAYENGLFAGTSAATFGFEENMTRQQMWIVLARMSGAAPATMEAARTWAMENIASDGTNPTGSITREQFVTLLWRYAGSPASSKDLSGYTDFNTVSAYARTAMAWAVENGIVSGTSAATLSPAATATRAQVAVILAGYCQNREGK